MNRMSRSLLIALIVGTAFNLCCAKNEAQSTAPAPQKKADPRALWQKIKKVFNSMDKKLEQIHAVAQAIVMSTHSSEQLTLVNDVLDLERQANDLHGQILELKKRFEQIYTTDPERAREIYAIIINEIALLKSIYDKMNRIKAGIANSNLKESDYETCED